MLSMVPAKMLLTLERSASGVKTVSMTLLVASGPGGTGKSAGDGCGGDGSNSLVGTGVGLASGAVRNKPSGAAGPSPLIGTSGRGGSKPRKLPVAASAHHGTILLT